MSLLLLDSLEPEPGIGEQLVSLTVMAFLNGLGIKMQASSGSSYKCKAHKNQVALLLPALKTFIRASTLKMKIKK